MGVHTNNIPRAVLDPSFFKPFRIQRVGGVCYLPRTFGNDEFRGGRLFSSRVNEDGLRIVIIIIKRTGFHILWQSE